MSTFKDSNLLFPPEASEKRKHKLKRLVQGQNSFFMDVKCPSCWAMYGCNLWNNFSFLFFCSTIVFSHVAKVVVCSSCNTVLAQPTGGKVCFSLSSINVTPFNYFRQSSLKVAPSARSQNE
eukprot:EG_transcript_52992